MEPSIAIPGCWTCRLRRKKCSGEKPTCSKCTLLNVPCYRYGPKPSWMDGGAQEKERSNEIRRSVKLTTDSQRRQRALRALRSSKEDQLVDRDDSTIREGRRQDRQSRTNATETRSLDSVRREDSSPIFIRHDHVSRTPKLARDPNPQLEPFLLMHYLDAVFHSQLPFYNPTLSDGGRGWMLCLLIQAKPLYNAALCLAAYHQNLVLSTEVGKPPPSTYNEQDHFYSMALRGLRTHIATLSNKGLKEGLKEGLKDGIEILACVCQLIMFEVARGGTENWHKHLMAAPDIYPFLRTYCTHPEAIDALTVPRFPHYERTHIKDGSSPYLSFIDHAAMEFYTGVIIWFDILGCVSTGLRPQYSDFCTAGLGDSSKLQLKRIMGCENWAMILIREIAVLSDWKRRVSEEGILNVLELARRANSIKRRLDERIDKLVAELDQALDGHDISEKASSSGVRNRREHITRKVTHAFACAAKVYLHVVVSGANPDLPEIVDSVSSTVSAMRSLPDLHLIQKLVWPFCIAGSMAKGNQRQVFKDLASKAGIEENVFGNSWRAFEVMQTCWNMHDGSRGNAQCKGDWLDAMKALGHQVLLI